MLIVAFRNGGGGSRPARPFVIEGDGIIRVQNAIVKRRGPSRPVGPHRDRDDTPYPYVWHAGPPGKAFWHISGRAPRWPRYRETRWWHGRASGTVTFRPFRQIILTRTVHGGR